MMKKKFSKPLAIALVVLGVIVATAAILYFFDNSVKNNERVQMEKIQSIAAMIDPDDIEKLNGNDSDVRNQSYINLLERVVDVVEVNQDIVYLYILKIKDGNVIFSVDSGSVLDGETWPGMVYDDISPKLMKAFETGEPQFHGLTDGNNTDDWGTWVTAYAPIQNADGEVLAVISMDIDRNDYLANIIIDTSPPVLMMLIFIIIVLFLWLSNKHKTERLDREKQLLSVASHEVRSPMVSIKWVLENMIETSQDLSETDRETILSVYNNASKIISSIEGILSSAPSWDRKKYREDNVYMKPLLQDIADTLILVAAQRRATIRLDDSITDDLSVKGDQQNLHHAFYNVVNNALKYTYLDTEVVVSYVRTDKFHQFHVSDRGPGVKPEDRKRIFEGLYRTPEALASKQPGTGLGLYFVKKIIENHGGQIYVDPDYTEGTSFVVELPL